MSDKSGIEWTDATWNPVTGCTKVSAGCKNCYAELMAERLRRMGAFRYRNGFEVTLHHSSLEIPRRWKRPRRIFVNSMSDLFHRHVPDYFIADVFHVMRQANQHTFQVLTKRPERIGELGGQLHWPPHVWMGTSVESAALLYRIDILRKVPAAVRFVSFEPLLREIGPVNLQGIHWAIVGGESGPGARPLHEDWVRSLRDQCNAQGVAFFFKQWGGVRKKAAGRILDGRTWDEMPAQSGGRMTNARTKKNSSIGNLEMKP